MLLFASFLNVTTGKYRKHCHMVDDDIDDMVDDDILRGRGLM